MFRNLKWLFVLGLRGLSLAAKLAFTIVLARWLSVEEFGQWVLILALVTYGIFIVGAEIYNITLRTYIAEGHAAVIAKFSARTQSLLGCSHRHQSCDGLATTHDDGFFTLFRSALSTFWKSGGRGEVNSSFSCVRG